MSTILEVDQSASSRVRLLGLNWDTTADTISVAPVNACDAVVRTKRDMIRFISKFFDPLGCFTPVVMKAKKLIKESWLCNLQWDEVLPDHLLKQWLVLAKDYDDACKQHIPRHTSIDWSPENRYELHIFCDASMAGYDVAAHLRTVRQDGTGEVHLIYSKTKCAPMKGTVTIPRLELLAAVMGVRVAKLIKKELPLEFAEISLWSDSMCVLGWIRNREKQQPAFVEHRLEEIRADSMLTFRYVRTDSNPVDLPSRGTDAADLVDNQLWWHGPQWLAQPSTAWPEEPKSESSSSPQPDCQPVEATSFLAECNTNIDTPFGFSCDHFSSLNALVRTTAFAFRFVENLKCDVTGRKVGCLTSQELSRARNALIKYVQHKHYSDCLQAIQRKSKNALVHQLKLFIDQEGLIRCDGRLEKADLQLDTKYPLLLPKRDRFTELVITSFHKNYLHAGVSHTLSQVRQQFWIPHDRSITKSVLRTCVTCRKWEGGPFAKPDMPPLPAERTTWSLAFTYCGVDYFGPLYEWFQCKTR